MRSPRITAITAVTASAAIAGVITGASQAAAHQRCQDIEATINDKVVAEGCPPGIQVCVVGTVRGKHGFDGTTVFVLETGTGYAGGTQQLTGGTGRYEGATGFTYLAQHFEVDHFVSQSKARSATPGADM